jgi:hypothetical protein
MLPIRLSTRFFPGGFQPQGVAGVLVADEREAKPLLIEAVDLEAPVFMHIMNAVTDADFQEFARRFWDQPVIHISELRSLWGRLYEAAMMALTGDDNRQAAGVYSVNWLLGRERLQPELRELGDRYRLCLEASSTATFMALEISTAFEVGAQITRCQHCRKAFLFGPHTGRRSHGKFCDDKCRVGAMRVRNAKKGAPR